MSHPIPTDAQRLADRLRLLADELESAARYGVPIPLCVSLDGYEHGNVSFSATAEEFTAWAEYTKATVTASDHHDKHWHRAEVDVNGLPLTFFTNELPAAEQVPA